jgi:tetratricopeptide (TPR) repeat protein
MATTLTENEAAQLTQTIEMFEVIAQSQPNDYQSLEILKEAYSKLGRDVDVLQTAKRIADAYVSMGQYSSAILEYETILQMHPADVEALKAMKDLESHAAHSPEESSVAEPAAIALRPDSDESTGRNQTSQTSRASTPAQPSRRIITGPVEDGRKSMYKIFVESKIIAAADFDGCWVSTDPNAATEDYIDPFIQVLSDKGVLPVEKSLKLLSDKTRIGFVPLDRYDIDMELARNFPAETCKRWCVLPFDRMSKSVMVATANPFNQQAAQELAEATPFRLLWFLVPPVELVKTLRKVFR